VTQSNHVYIRLAVGDFL